MRVEGEHRAAASSTQPTEDVVAAGQHLLPLDLEAAPLEELRHEVRNNGLAVLRVLTTGPDEVGEDRRGPLRRQQRADLASQRAGGDRDLAHATSPDATEARQRSSSSSSDTISPYQRSMLSSASCATSGSADAVHSRGTIGNSPFSKADIAVALTHSSVTTPTTTTARTPRRTISSSSSGIWKASYPCFTSRGSPGFGGVRSL